MPSQDGLIGFRMLVVEDETLIAMMLEEFLADLGIKVVEVAGTLARGLAIATDAAVAADGAILDANLGGEKVFPVADALAGRGVPFVFATGYGLQGLAPRYADHKVIAKPFRLEPLKQFLLSAFA